MQNKTETPSLSKEDWTKFLRSEEKRLWHTYEIDEKRFISDANVEHESRGDYQGREILELLQNADDAATEQEKPGRVLFEITENGLIIGNTGKIFSTGGLDSILLAHVSPKRKEDGILIGAKGLGFRALLNWTEAPVILSGNLEVGFSRSHSVEQVSRLCKKIPSLQERMKKSQILAPILRFPFWADIEERVGPIIVRARALRPEYDTIIVVPFSDENVQSTIMEQLQELSPRLLLFLQTVEQIEISGLVGGDKTFRREINGKVTKLLITTSENADSEKWILKTASEQFPPEYAAEDDIRQILQLTAAIRVDEDCDCEPLSSFFPTQHDMPLPGLFHATFDLEQNRQHLRDTKANKFVIGRLAALHADLIEELSHSEVLNPLGFMVVQGSPQGFMEIFVERFFQEMRTRSVIPTRGAGFVRPEQANAFPEPEHEFSDKRWFQNYVPVHNNNEREILERLGVKTSSEVEVVSYLRDRQFSVPQRANVIVQLAEQGYSCAELRQLLMGEGGATGSKTTRWFPPPGKGGKRIVKFPEGSGFRFVHRELWQKICEGLGEEDELAVEALSCFGVENYDPRSIISAYSARLAELADDHRANFDRRRKDFLTLLVAVFEGPRGGIATLSSINIWWPNAIGEWHLAEELHVAEPGSQSGRVNRQLFSSRPDLLAKQVADMEVDLKPSLYEAFLKWIGINTWPRKTERPLEQFDWELILEEYPETVSYKDSRGATKLESLSDHGLSVYGNTGFLGETKWIEALDDILDCGSDAAILEWLGSSEGALLEDMRTTLRFKPPANAIIRDVLETPNRSLILSRISRENWIRDDFEMLCAPCNLILPEKRTAMLQKPFLSINHFGPRPFALSDDALESSFRRAGVSQNIELAPPPAVFGALLRLAKLKADPKIVLPIYRKISHRSDLSATAWDESRAKFLDDGRLLARGPKGLAWYKPEEIKYVAQENALRNAISGICPVFDIKDARQAFLEAVGVQSIARQAITINSVSTKELREDLSNKLVAKFDDCKRWISAWAQHIECVIEREKTVISAAVRVTELPVIEMEIEGKTLIAPLPPWNCLFYNDHFILSVEPGCNQVLLRDIGYSKFAQTIAEYLNLSGVETFREMFRAESSEARLRHMQLEFPELNVENLEEMIRQDFDILDKNSVAENSGHLPPLPPTEITTEENSDFNDLEDVGPEDIATLEKRITNEKEAADSETKRWMRVPPESRAEHEKEEFLVGGRPGKRRRISVSSTGRIEENEVYHFEKAQERFPYSLDKERGSRSEGCDLVSFSSAEQRNKYLETRNSELVDRFIEVKGGDMRLSTNQESAARRYGRRYYVYHVRKNGTIETYNDPVIWSKKEDWVLVVDQDHAPVINREKFVPK